MFLFIDRVLQDTDACAFRFSFFPVGLSLFVQSLHVFGPPSTFYFRLILNRPSEFSGSNYGQSVPIPVPTQIHNYQRMEQNLQFPGQEGSPQWVKAHS